MSEPVKSAQRVLELIEFFAEWRRPASVNEICQSLGYPQSSTSVLMKSLTKSGYFDHDPRTGMYVPNVRLAVATGWIQAQLFSEQSLLRLMESVLARCGHTVMIGEQQGVHVRYLHVLQATREGRFLARSGALRSLFHSAAGKMILTTRTEREVAQLLRRANGIETDPALRIEFEPTRLELETIRREGYAMSTGTSMPGAAALAILLPVPQGHSAMTLSLGGPIKEVRRERRDDAHHAVLQRSGYAPNTGQVFRIEVSGQPELGVIGQPDNIGFVAEADHGRNGTGDLFARDARSGRNVA